MTSHYLNQCWPDSLTYRCGTRGRWINNVYSTQRKFDWPGSHFMKYFSIIIEISMDVSFYSYPSRSEVIDMKLCTWHDCCAVVVCAKFCSNMIPCTRVTLEPIFLRIWMMIEISFMKWAPAFEINNAYKSLSIELRESFTCKILWYIKVPANKLYINPI